MIETALSWTKNTEELQLVFTKSLKDYSEFSKNFRDNLKSGQFVDVKDSYNKWRLGVVNSVSAAGEASIHFDGWDSKWDEVSSLGRFF